MTVRLLGPGDEEHCAFFEGDATEFLADPRCVLTAAFGDDGTAVGWCYGHELPHPDGDRTMLLYSLDVDEAHRRRGHGRAVVEAFVDEARRRGCSEVWVLTDDDNEAALATYAASGGVREPGEQVMFVWALAARQG